jgi:ligand-binding sensor protein
MNLTNLAPLERWRELEKAIHQRFGLDANVFDVKGYRISDFKAWANSLCPEIKATDKGQSFICAPAHMNIANMAMRSKKTVIEECDAGLLKMVVPIFVNGEFIGAVGACGVILDEGEVDTFLINKVAEIDEDRIELLSKDLPSAATEKVQAAGRYIEEQIALIVGEFDSGKGSE